MLVLKDDGPITRVLERNEVAFEMCPAAFYTADLIESFDRAEELGLSFRDEPAMMLALYPNIVMVPVEGHRSGFKLTYPEDMEILAAFRRHFDGSKNG
jgi:2-C-methyl-D-erythritol 4-phosphate cytidylyltransferase